MTKEKTPARFDLGLFYQHSGSFTCRNQEEFSQRMKSIQIDYCNYYCQQLMCPLISINIDTINYRYIPSSNMASRGKVLSRKQLKLSKTTFLIWYHDQNCFYWQTEDFCQHRWGKMCSSEYIALVEASFKIFSEFNSLQPF